MWFYVDTMYNYEIESAECEFLKDDEGEIWLTNMAHIKVSIKEGYEESIAFNGVSYCHPPGKDPEIQGHHIEAMLDQKRKDKLCEHYDGKMEEEEPAEGEERVDEAEQARQK